jgi:hypothetical protein
LLWAAARISLLWRGQTLRECEGAVAASATIENLANGFVVAVRELIAHSQTSDADIYTPSDFPLASLNEESLKKLELLLDDFRRTPGK